MAKYFGDRTAEMLGRLSLNPLRHIDPVGTVLVPGILLLIGAPVIGWARPVPVATKALRNPRRAMVAVAIAGPVANLMMALVWCAVLAAIGTGLAHGCANTASAWVRIRAVQEPEPDLVAIYREVCERFSRTEQLMRSLERPTPDRPTQHRSRTASPAVRKL